jgi:hypothetical protein
MRHRIDAPSSSAVRAGGSVDQDGELVTIAPTYTAVAPDRLEYGSSVSGGHDRKK